MDKSSESSNFEWKQTGVDDKNTKVSRRIDEKKLAMQEKKVPNALDTGMKRLKSTTPDVLKMRSKIREVFDDEDDEEENENIVIKPPFLDFENDGNSSLINGLREDERQKLQIEQTLHNQNMQQTVGKMEAIAQADKLLRQSGVKRIDKDLINENMIKVETDQLTFTNTIKQQLEQKEKINTDKISTVQEATNLLKGVYKTKKAALFTDVIDKKKIEKLEAKELQEIGKEKDDRKIAQTIMKKTGRKDKKSNKITPKQREEFQNKIKEALKQKENQRDVRTR